MKKKTICLTSLTLFLSIASLIGCNSKKEFVVEWKNYDGELLERDMAVPKGAVPTYDSNRPVHYDDSGHYYVFKGWDKELKGITKDETFTAVFDSFSKTNVDEHPDNYVEALPINTKDGMILHAFNWTFNQIKHNLPYIADAGFKSVQTSPVQTPKSNGSSWWAFYQPLSFSIAEESPLGTKEELIDLCTEAETYNISIIVDVVFNHMANIGDGQLESDGTPKVSPLVETYEPEIYANRNNETNPTFHHNKNAKGSGVDTQYYAHGDLPDLNTSNELVQERCYSFLKECIDAGVDGFRFDAAKHIETPDDPDYPSDFWTKTLGLAKTYYKNKNNKDLYAYGEVLGSPANRNIDVYTKIMDVTDDSYCNFVLSGVSNKDAKKAVNAAHGKGVGSGEQLVTWLESHDSYIGSDNPWSNPFMARSWATLGSRKDNRGLYLARPDNINDPSVGVIGDYYFKDETVGVINRFHNRFVGKDEKASSDGSIFINERGADDELGAVIVDYQMSKKVVVDFNLIKTGVFYDQLTGKSVVVRNGHATIEMDDSGISVLTTSKNLPRPSFDIDDRGSSFFGSKTIHVETKNAPVANYRINNGEPVSFSGNTDIIFADNQAIDGVVTLKVTVGNEQHNVEETFYYKTVELIPGYFNVVNVKQDYIDNYEIYMWAWGGSYGNGKWVKDYTVNGTTLLMDLTNKPVEGFLLGLFAKNYVPANLNAWDNNVIKQTVNIANSILEQGYFDASNF